MTNYTEFLAMVSSEFHRFTMEDEKIASKIPINAMVIIQVEGEEDFNKWHRETSLRNREQNQQAIYVNVKKWRTHSSIEELNVEELVDATI